MIISFKQLLITTALVFTVYLLNALLIEDIHAGTVVEEMYKKGEQCVTWAYSQDQSSDHARDCINQCGRYAKLVDRNPEALTDKNVQKCNEAYASAKNHASSRKKATLPITKDPDDRRTSRVLTNELPKTTMSSMPDIEGIYLQAMQGRLRVRAEDRDDWNKICRESARVKDPNYELARQLKSYDRIRLIGITYDTSKVGNGLRSPCFAERGIILE